MRRDSSSFAIASALVALAPGAGWLVAFRLLQGATGALLVPNSLALVDAAFVEEERGAAIGRWAGWSGVSTALGPLVGGWLVDGLGWRWVFAVMIPFALAAAWIVWRKVPEVGLAPGRPGPWIIRAPFWPHSASRVWSRHWSPGRASGSLIR